MNENRQISFVFSEIDAEVHCELVFNGEYSADELMLAAALLLRHVVKEIGVSPAIEKVLVGKIGDLCEAKRLNDEDIEWSTKH